MHIELEAGVVTFGPDCKPVIVALDENFKIMES